jgi:hypothetical protein
METMIPFINYPAGFTSFGIDKLALLSIDIQCRITYT